ncbi:PucC family protein [Rhodovibrio salinarum]|uniref:MFS transporter n=1 Tax=Rhodovibrio salinarum TaxID=1087 RepID=A0A934QKY6_9PROT|nr:PucC family protein [Rhodovibrio salinarum]MBK1698657.1 MFS transporter [Rhodovibrio salinarum]
MPRLPHLTRKLTTYWLSLGPRFLPYADVALPDLPWARLLRLSLFQVSVGMALVLLVGTLNRVMIVELGVPTSLVAVMVALPLLAAPFRALIGFRSDSHRCELGWRRVPFIYRGTLLQFGGFAIMPFALLVLAGMGESSHLPAWVGEIAAALAFLLVGAGAHMVQTVGLALATDLTPSESHPKVVGLMYVMLLFGMMLSALVFGVLLADFSPGRLVQVIQGAAVLTAALNFIALWKQEPRNPPRGAQPAQQDPSFRECWQRFCQGRDAVRRLVIVGLGTIGFGMADVVLEPYGGEVLGLSVSTTTKLTALFAFGGLVGFAFAWFRLARGGHAYRVAHLGALLGISAFILVMLSAPLDLTSIFLIGNFLIGFGGALFWHGTLTVTMNQAPKDQAGLALGAWGAVQATAAGSAMAMSGLLRDGVQLLASGAAPVLGVANAAAGYMAVYAFEIALLLVTVIATLPLLRRLSTPGESATTATGDPTPAGVSMAHTTEGVGDSPR